MIEFRDFDLDTRLKNINIQIERGDVVFLVGPNGAGKSSLLSSFFEKKSSQILLDNRPVSEISRLDYAKYVAYLDQEYLPVGKQTVREFLLDILQDNKTKLDFDDICSKLKIDHKFDSPLDQLSGGEKRRVSIAIQILRDTPVIILDEPWNHLDPDKMYRISKFVVDFAKDHGKTMLIVDHSLSLAYQLSTKILALNNGEIFYFGENKREFFEEDLENLFEMKFEIIDGYVLPRRHHV